MKTLLPLLFLLVSITSVAQTTNYSGFNYQAVVRDAQGQPLPNQIVGVQILIRESPLDLTGYVENHNVTSDAQGLITLTIGQGTVDGSSVVANFGDIDWRSAGAMAYSISMDITGGTNYQYLGGSVLQAVPYAMHALTSENSGWVVNMDTLENAGKQVNITNSTGDAPLSVISEAYGFEHLYDYGAGVGTVKLSSYLGSATDPTDAGGWFGTKSEHPLYLYTNDGLPQVTLNTSGNLGVGTMLPEARLDVAGTFKFADGSEGTGKFLTSDGDGNASWQNLSAESLLGSGNVPSGDLSCLSNVATIATGTQPSAISFSGNFAYVLNNNSNNMMVFDISDPRAPGLSATIATGTNPSAVAVSGNFAYVVNAGSNNMLVFDISTPSAPVLSTTIATGSLPLSIAVSGNYAFVLNWISSNMMVFDLTTPGTPSLSATIATGGSPEQVIVSGNYAYVLNGNSTLMVYDIGNPGAPSLSATIATGVGPISAAVSGNYIYVVNNGSNNMMVFDISTPSTPSLSATIAAGTNPYSVAVSGNYASVADRGSNNLMLYDISTPSAPILSTTIAAGSQPISVAVQGNYAYVLNYTGDNMMVYDLFCRAAITIDPSTGQLTSQNINTLGGGEGWELNGNVLSNTNSGNVGIGTTAPVRKLHVNGGIHVANELRLGLWANNYTSDSSPRIYAGNGGPFTPGDLILQARTNHGSGVGDIHLATGANNVVSTKLLVRSNGDVGIGTTAPLCKLDVRGKIQAVNFGNPTATNDRLELYADGIKSYIRSYGDDQGLEIESTTASKIYLKANDTYCTGKLFAREVEVTLAAFPDYVFDADYKLMPLAEVEAFIATNGHLPNVPSACEVEENGIGLGEMNKILLEKVEELTLHLIEQERLIKDQGAALNELRMNLDPLKTHKN